MHTAKGKAPTGGSRGSEPSGNNPNPTMNTIFYVVGAVVVIGVILKMLGLY
jgi:hypothetical protein